jgi:PKD repeat protein
MFLGDFVGERILKSRLFFLMAILMTTSIVLVGPVHVQVTANASSTVQNTIFSDDFESYAVGTLPSPQWNLAFNGNGNEYQVIVNTVSCSPTQSFQLMGNVNWAADAVHYFNSSNPTVGFAVNVRIDNTSSIPQYGGYNDAARVGFWKQIDWGDAAWYESVTFAYNGTIIANGASAFPSGQILQSWVPDQWYDVKLIVDRQNKVFSVWINGTLEGQNLPECSSSYSYDGFAVSGRYTQTLDYFDDVSIFEIYQLNSTPPTIINVYRTPDAPDYTQDVLVTAFVYGADYCALSYSVDGVSWYNVSMTQAGNDFTALIPAQIVNTTVQYLVYAGNITIYNWVESDTYSYTASNIPPPPLSVTCFSVEPVAVPPLTDINASINGLETPPTPSPVGQNFTVEIHLRNATSTNVPTGVSGLEVHFYFGNILSYAVPTGFACTLGQAGWVLTGPSLLYGINPGFYDASGNLVSNPPYAGAVYFEIAAASTNGPWNRADGLVATISFRIIKQPQGQNGEPTVTLQLTNDFTDLVDLTSSPINTDSVQGTLSIDTTTGISPPVASFSYSPLLPTAGESITFDASSSSPGWNGTQTMPIVSYAWDFGDSNTATGQVVTHAYADSGNYTVTLNVTDSEGLWLAEQRQIQVVQPTGPVAEFTTSPETGSVGESMDFNASSSIGGWNGTAMPITEYLWDFGDGGSVISGVGSTIVHDYTYAERFNVTLTVSDSENITSSCSHTVLVIMPTSISVSTSATSSLIGYMVDINGTLSDIYGNAIGNEPVVLYYAFPAFSVFITSTTTDDNGQYSAQWIPTATGTFCIVAEWAGNITYSAASSNVTMSCIATTNQYVFSVESNSTITGLAFNTTSQELSFTASGPSGTTGYAKVTIAKSLVSNITNITVYLDNNQTEYSITSTDDSWLLMFNYTHSTHTIRVDLSTSVIPEFSNNLILFLLVTLAAAVLVAEERKLAKLHSNRRQHARATSER